jgi:hypothetical protein
LRTEVVGEHSEPETGVPKFGGSKVVVWVEEGPRDFDSVTSVEGRGPPQNVHNRKIALKFMKVLHAN